MRKELGVLYAEYLELEEKILKIDGEKLKDEMYILKSKLEEVNEGYVEEDEDEDDEN